MSQKRGSTVGAIGTLLVAVAWVLVLVARPFPWAGWAWLIAIICSIIAVISTGAAAIVGSRWWAVATFFSIGTAFFLIANMAV